MLVQKYNVKHKNAKREIWNAYLILKMKPIVMIRHVAKTPQMKRTYIPDVDVSGSTAPKVKMNLRPR